MVSRRRSSRRSKPRWLWPVAVSGGVVIAALIALWLDSESGEGIRKGTQVSGVDLGGLDRPAAVSALEPLRETLAATRIELQFQDQSITATAQELGLAFDAEKTLADAEDPPAALVRPAAWLYDLFAARDVTPQVNTDMETLDSAITPYTDPQTPRIKLVNGEFAAVDSTEVAVPDMQELARLLEEAVLDDPGGEVKVVVPISGMRPADPISSEMSKTLAEQANELTAGGVRLRLEGRSETLRIEELALRRFISVSGELRDARLSLHQSIERTLESLFVGIGAEAEPADITIDDAGAVVITGGEAGFKCCGDGTADALLAGMIADTPVIELPAETLLHPRGREWAKSLGITEVVGEFTTNFRPGQDRVTNIARIAELTQGAIIEPGEQFSVNEFVGPRTLAKGFVTAGVIYNGVFVEAVGGGISQFATTLFNAAFFAGLEFVTYQSHTIYISRYPYGREATVSHPAPDLVLENTSPYGVMLWPTTTADSVTVKLYSTRWVNSAQTGQWSRPEGTSCTRVTTQRTRTWLDDGHSETDTVSARYRPEGLRCDGMPSVTSTTTLPPTTCSAGCEEQ